MNFQKLILEMLQFELPLQVFKYTVKPRYNAFQGSGQNFTHYKDLPTHKDTLEDQNVFALVAAFRYTRVRYNQNRADDKNVTCSISNS